MTKLVFVKKEDKKGIFKHPRKTNDFLPKRRTCPPKRGRMVTLNEIDNWCFVATLTADLGTTYLQHYVMVVQLLEAYAY